MTERVCNAVEAMRRVSNQRRARQILTILRDRIDNIVLVRWPALEQSFRDELAKAEEVARERRFAV